MEFITFFIINVIRILKYAILVRILISWISPQGGHGKAYRVIYDTTEPTLRFCRKILPRTGMLDFSPLLAFFALDLLEYAIIKSL